MKFKKVVREFSKVPENRTPYKIGSDVSATFSQSPDPRIKFFDNLASSWDRKHLLDETIHRLNSIKHHLSIPSGTSILDIGCGTGNTTYWLIKYINPAKVVGIDFSPEMIKIASSKNIPATFICADVCLPDFSIPGDYDLAFCCHCFPHLRDKYTALKNIYNLLTPHANLIILHFSGKDHINEFHKTLDYPINTDIIPSFEELRRLFNETGFVVEKHIDTPDLYLVQAKKV